MSDELKREQSSTLAADDTSPWKPGECLCGIPNCAGHKVVDGKILLEGHPTLGAVEALLPAKKAH